jgi:hypothetical protein
MSRRLALEEAAPAGRPFCLPALAVDGLIETGFVGLGRLRVHPGIAGQIAETDTRWTQPSFSPYFPDFCFLYTGKPVDAKAIGKDLGVRYVLEGSLQPIGNQMRVNAQLIDAAKRRSPLGRTIRHHSRRSIADCRTRSSSIWRGRCRSDSLRPRPHGPIGQERGQ